MMDIDTMEAGPELNALVATDVLEWKWCLPYKITIGGVGRPYPPAGAWLLPSGSYETNFRPSEYIATAWEVVEKMTTQEKGWGVSLIENSELGTEWSCEFWRSGKRYSGNGNYYDERVGDMIVGPCTAPLAICRAALKAVEATK